MLKLYAFIDINSTVDLLATGAIISRKLFAGQQFVYQEGLRDEVPGLALETEVFGIGAVLYGGDGAVPGSTGEKKLFCLEILPGQSQFRHRFTHWMGIGEWIAQILADVPEFKIVKWLPNGENVIGAYST